MGTLQPEAAILNAALVPDLFAVHLAALKALQAAARGQLKTRSLHAEVVFGVSGSKHVSPKRGRAQRGGCEGGRRRPRAGMVGQRGAAECGGARGGTGGGDVAGRALGGCCAACTWPTRTCASACSALALSCACAGLRVLR